MFLDERGDFHHFELYYNRGFSRHGKVGSRSYSLPFRPDYTIVYKAHNEDFSKLLWPEQFDKEYFVAKRQSFIDQGFPEGYSQEFLNNPIDEATAYFRSSDLRSIPEDNAPEEYYVGIDLGWAFPDLPGNIFYVTLVIFD